MLGWNAGMQQCCDAAMQWGSIGVNDGQWVFLGGEIIGNKGQK